MKKCEYCGAAMEREKRYSHVQWEARRFCSARCRGKALKPEGLHHWGRCRTLAGNGYWMVRCPIHPHANNKGYVFEHRLIAESMLGRIIPMSYNVHHINGIVDDNRPENLMVMTQKEHSRFHALASGLGRDSKEYRSRDAKGQFK